MSKCPYATVILEDRVLNVVARPEYNDENECLGEEGMLSNAQKDYYFEVQFHRQFPKGNPLQNRVCLDVFRNRLTYVGPFSPSTMTVGQAHEFLSSIGELYNYHAKLSRRRRGLVIPIVATEKGRSPEKARLQLPIR